MKVLLSWIGMTDMKAARGETDDGSLGPIGSAAKQMGFTNLVLLSDFDEADAAAYRAWFTTHFKADVDIHLRPLNSPTAFREIYHAAVSSIESVLAAGHAELAFLASAGTPAMAAVWLILGKTRFPAEVIQTHFNRRTKQSHAEIVDFPFEFSAEFVEDMFREPDARLVESATARPPESPAFEEIVHRCQKMKTVIRRARHVAHRSVPVLLLGESGTGKELFARAIHRASPRREAPFIALNCGAIPKELVESELFGHIRGSFTGADKTRQGAFESAHGGTLFLDELGELPLEHQVKLLRVIQEGVVKRVGDSEERAVDVRLICATHRDLYRAVFEDAFREDLFHRIAVAVLTLPPLREREGDLSLLVDTLMEQLAPEVSVGVDKAPTGLTPEARNVLLRHRWPGNVRELRNTLLRAMIWCETDILTASDVQDAILKPPANLRDSLLERPLDETFDIQEVLSEVKRVYILRALRESNNTKRTAAKLLGLGSHQTLTNWMAQVGLEEG